jgi:hypothetical protein
MSVYGPQGSRSQYTNFGQNHGPTRLHLRNDQQIFDAEFRPLFESLNPNRDSARVVQGVVVDENQQEASQRSLGAAFSPYYEHLSRANVQAQQRATQDPINQRVRELEREVNELRSMIGDGRTALNPNQSLPPRYTGHARTYSSLIQNLTDTQNHIANA